MSDRVREYVARIVAQLAPIPPASPAPAADNPAAVAGDIFSILTSREFCYLGRTRTTPYRDNVAAVLTDAVGKGEPARFYYDLGAGYHASIDPGGSGLIFEVGFSELCALAQIASFCNRVVEVYPPGAKFVLVIDNVCGLVTNNIPIERTAAYCAELRLLIDETCMRERVDVLVESEEFDPGGYQVDRARLATDIAALQPSPADVENVVRFLGRPCDGAEAAERIALYRQAGEMTEHRLASLVRGVRLTQRATGGTLGFRPFPGGDSRTQVGEVAISPNEKGALRPILLTSRNVGRYHCTRRHYPHLLPRPVRHVTFAEPTAAPHPSA